MPIEYVPKQTLLLCLPSLTQFMEASIAQGVRSEVNSDETIFVMLPAGLLPPEEQYLPFHTDFHAVINRLGIDRVVLHGGGLQSQSSNTCLLELANHYGPKKTINIGPKLPGYVSVSIENKKASQALARHLVLEKKLTRFLVIRGPLTSKEATERFTGLREELENHNITLQNNQVLQGSFFAEDTYKLILNYLENGGSVPEVIVCPNDLAARGTFKALTKLHIQVPEQVFVTGFDNFEYAATLPVPLTTIAQPTQQLGSEAAKLSLRQLNNEKIDDLVLSTQLLRRTSTGMPELPDESQAFIYQSESPWSLRKLRENSEERLSISRIFNTSENTNEALLKITERLPFLGLDAFFLFLTDDFETDSTDAYLNTYILNGQTVQPNEKIPVDSFLIHPIFLVLNEMSEGDWIAAPVFNKDHFLGFILCNASPIVSDYIEMLALQIADSIESDQVAQATQILNERMYQNEKMASLGGLVSGVAHEVNTPIGVSKLAASNLTSEIDTVLKKFQTGGLGKAAFEEFLTVSRDSARIIESNLDRAATLISTFKKVAVDQTIEEKRQINLATYIEEVLESLRLKVKGTSISFETNLADDIELLTEPGAWAQVINNIVLNSILHGFDEGKKAGTIKLTLKQKFNNCVLIISDNGMGIPEDIQPKIFEPFVTTKRGNGGTGLGMHIVYNLITQRLNGHVNVSSNTRNGVTFTIICPLQAK